MRRPLVALIAFAFLALATAGVTAVGIATVGAAPGAIRPAGAASPLTMTVGTLGSIGSLDPRRGDSTIAREVWNLQYPTLTELDPKTLQPTTGVADAWSPLPHDRGWRYAIRPNQAWSDGKPVTAADVVYSFDQARDGHWPYAAGMLTGLSARAVNAHTVDVTTDAGATSAKNGGASETLPGLLVHVVPEHVYAKVADLDTDVAALGVADGAWHVVATTTDSVQLGVLGRPGGPPLDQIEFRTYPSANALIDALAHRQVDVISGVPDSDLARLEGMPKVTVDHASDGTEYVLRFASFPAKPLQGIVSLAIDRTALVAAAVNGVGTEPLVGAEPGRAKRDLLALPPGESHPRGPQPTIAIPADPTGREVGAFVQQSLAAIGLDTKVVGAGTRADLVIERVSVHDIPAGAIDLFQPDTLQAFRTDHLTGFLTEPEQRSLVVFGPTVAQYDTISAAPPPPGETMSNTTYAIGAAILLALTAVGYWIASRIRQHYVA